MLRRATSVIFKSTCLLRDSRVITARYQSTDYSSQCEGLVVEPNNQVLWIKLDRPKKLNSITREMYIKITETLRKVNSDSSIKAIVLTGNGDYYSSGNDLSNFKLAMQHESGVKAGMEQSSKILFDFVESFINLEKFLIAAVNGPAVGISVSTLALCDLVIASDKATFSTPFTALGQTPEACSSFTFPQILGRTKASELLLLNMTWDAKKALDSGFISEVIQHDKFAAHVDNFTKHLVKTCYPKALVSSKMLIQRDDLRKELLKINKKECEVILDCWLGEECADAVQKFFRRSSK